MRNAHPEVHFSAARYSRVQEKWCVWGQGEGAKSNSENSRFPFLSHACAGSCVLAVGAGGGS